MYVELGCGLDIQQLCQLMCGPFCSGVGDLRALHAFPTRRSSDLPAARRGWRWCRTCRPSCRSPAHRRAEGRSEEHTSELQSRPHLVCRLLLEKKKLESADPA